MANRHKLAIRFSGDKRRVGRRGNLSEESDAALMRATVRGVEEMKRVGVRLMGRSPGNARRDIKTRVTRVGDHKIRAEVYTTAKVPYWLSRGTGLFGPYKTRITPRTAEALRFRIGGRIVYARSVKGMRGNRWLERTGEATEQAIKQYYREELDRVFGRRPG